MRRLAVVSALVLVAGLFWVLRDEARAISTVTTPVPATSGASVGTTVEPPPAPGAFPDPSRSDSGAGSRAGPAAGFLPPHAAGTPRPQASGPLGVPATPVSGGPSAQAPPPRPPSAGVYRYRYIESTASSQGTDAGSVTVSRSPAVTGAGATGRAAPGATAGQGPGAEGVEETETERVGTTTRSRILDWSGDVVAVAASDSGAGRCFWQPKPAAWRLPFAVGQTWQTGGSCTFPTAAGSTMLSQQEDARVDGLASTSVNGQRVETWVIERHTILSETVGGVTVLTQSQSTELFAPAYGLVVYRVGRTLAPDGTKTATTDTVMELLDTRPA